MTEDSVVYQVTERRVAVAFSSFSSGEHVFVNTERDKWHQQLHILCAYCEPVVVPSVLLISSHYIYLTHWDRQGRCRYDDHSRSERTGAEHARNSVMMMTQLVSALNYGIFFLDSILHSRALWFKVTANWKWWHSLKGGIFQMSPSQRGLNQSQHNRLRKTRYQPVI